jgi:uncharacterized membrane protein YdbT with pleckstrin-like domain
MGYDDRQLGPGEEVLARTRLHPVIFAEAATFATFVLGTAALIIARNELAPDTVRLLWLVAAVLGALAFVSPYLRWRISEFTVTTRRVIVKSGLLSRHALELPLPKVETIAVDKTLCGRWLGYGTLRLVGKGDTVDEYPRVRGAEVLREAALRQGQVSRARQR